VPTVPRYDSFQASENATPTPRIGGQVADASGYTPQRQAQDLNPNAGKQMMQAGAAMQQLGEVGGRIVADIQREANITVGKDIETQVVSATADALYHPENGFMVKQGKDAMAASGDTLDTVKKINQDALNDVKNPAVRQMLAPVLASRMQHTVDAINRHAGQETKKYQIQTADSRAIVSLQDAALNFADGDQFNKALGVAKQEAATLGRLQGWDEDTTRLQATKYQDAGYKMRYEAMRLKDPAGAFANFQQNADQISPLVREQIGAHLFQSAAPVLAQQLNQAGGVGMVAPSPADGGAPLPRGIRNNNPGNVSKGTDSWQGEVQGNDPRYVTFATPEAGIRAMGKTLINYQDKYGLNTVEGIVSRWAPATENDTGAYTATVAKALGVKADAPIDLHDSATLNTITKAMIKVENGPGAARITDQQIALGLAAANGGALPAALPTAQRDPAAATGYAAIDALPVDWKLHVMQLARAQSHQDMAEARETLRSKVQDSSAAFMATGFAPNAPNEAEFIRAYGQAEGVRNYRDFQNVATLGQTLQQVRTLPTADLASMLETAKPTPGDGFAARQHNYEILTHAISTVQKARQEDPVAYALTSKSFGLSPIQNFNDSKGLAGELSRRAAAAPLMATNYGTAPQLLTKSEASALSATIKAVPVESQKAQLATIYAGIKDMGLFKQTMQAIAPDNPTAAVAGIYQARGLKTTQDQDVADLILRGQAILTPNKKTDGSGHEGGQSLIKMPEAKLMLSDWNAVTGDAFKGKEQAGDLFQQTAKAIYAARSAEEGDYSGLIDSKRWKASIMLATGGIESHNGSRVVMPYGLGYDQFQNALKATAESVVKSGGALNTTAAEMMRLPVENIGDGRYIFRRGAGYLVSKDGRPVVADLSGGR